MAAFPRWFYACPHCGALRDTLETRVSRSVALTGAAL